MTAKKLGVASHNASYVFWQRIFQPFICLIMLGIAVIIFFNFERGQQYGRNITSALLLGVGFYFSREYMSAFCLYYGIYPFLAAVLPLMVGLGIWAVLLRLYFKDSVWYRLTHRHQHGAMYAE